MEGFLFVRCCLPARQGWGSVQNRDEDVADEEDLEQDEGQEEEDPAGQELARRSDLPSEESGVHGRSAHI